MDYETDFLSLHAVAMSLILISMRQACLYLVKKSHSSAFTIVELLVVIVVIAILAAISLVAYSGISQKAAASVLQSDLSNISTALKTFQAEKGNYPTTVSIDCNASPDTNTNKCIKLSSGNSIVGYSANNLSSRKNFYLVANNNITAYKVTGETGPTQISTDSTQPGTTPGAIVVLHAAKANGGTSQGINSPLTTTWYDTSGNGNHGTLTGFSGSPWLGAGSQADPYRLSFDGAQGVTLPNLAFAANKTFSDEVWFYSISSALSSGAYAFIASESGPTSGNYAVVGWNFYSDYTDYRSLRYYFRAQDGSGTSSGTNFSPDSGWAGVLDGGLHHAVAASNGSVVKLYVDGVLRTSSPPTVPTGTMVVDQDRVGQARNGQAPYIRPIVSHRVYPFALTAAQVTDNFNAGADW